MESLGTYMIRELENTNGHMMSDYNSLLQQIGATHAATLLGSIMLDSIFYVLHQYLDVIISTESDKNYSTDEPFKYIGAVAKYLDIQIHCNMKYNHTKLGNPSKNLNAFTNLFSYDGEIKDRNKAKKELIRNKGLHIYLGNISSILFQVSSHIESSKTAISNRLKYIFFFYCVNTTFQLLKNHLFSKYINRTNEEPFTRVYAKLIEAYLYNTKRYKNHKLSKIYDSMEVFITQNFDRSVKIITDYLESNEHIIFLKDVWIDISKIDYINSFLSNFDYSVIIEQIEKLYKTDFIIGEEKNYTGNMRYIQNIVDSLFSSCSVSGEDLFSKEYTPSEYKNMVLKILYESERCIRNEQISNDNTIDIIQNPFICFQSVFPCKQCPFQMFAKSVDELSKDIKIATDDVNMQIHNFEVELCNIDDDEYKYQLLDIVNQLRTKFRSIKMIENSNPIIINIDDIGNVEMEDCDEKRILVDYDNDIEEKYNYKLYHITNTCEFISPLSEILISQTVDESIDGLLNSMKGKSINNYIVSDFEMHTGHAIVDSLKPFPCLGRRCISEWKEFFKTFCYIETDRIAKNLRHDKPNPSDYKKCYGNFLLMLRKSFIINMISEIRGVGFFTPIC